jgi:plasmid maintenance system killer protein
LFSSGSFCLVFDRGPGDFSTVYEDSRVVPEHFRQKTSHKIKIIGRARRENDLAAMTVGAF